MLSGLRFYILGVQYDVGLIGSKGRLSRLSLTLLAVSV